LEDAFFRRERKKMSTTEQLNPIAKLAQTHQAEILADWIKEQLAATTYRRDLLKESELREQSERFLKLLIPAFHLGTTDNFNGREWTPIRDFLASISRTRAAQGFTPTETATFVLSLKQPLFTRLRKVGEKNITSLMDDLWSVTVLLDKLGLLTMEYFQKSREDIIARQQEEMLELSTPVVKLWEGILALPMIGTLDSARTQVVMETLLQRIVETGSEVAIIDITGVPTVDTLVAQHLLKTVAAARLMGADCIISGIRPQIAQTMVHLAIDLSNVITKANLADAFAVALQRSGRVITKGSGQGVASQSSAGQQVKSPQQAQNGLSLQNLPQMNH
jgi:rsbT co-antagonist protein RsbR